MTFAFLTAQRTLTRLHNTTRRKILQAHQLRHESTKASEPASRNISTNAIAKPSPPLPRTIPGPAWAWIDPLLTPFRAYGRMQKRSPLMTQFESSLVIYYLGDLSSQVISTNVFIDGEYEPLRALRAMVIGGIMSIPGYRWFIFLGNNFNYGHHVFNICVKTVVNQMVFTPLFSTYFFGMHTLLSGGTLREARERVMHTVPISWKNSWKVWPAVTAFSFTFIPWQYRNIFAGAIAIGWQSYLSWLNKKEEDREKLEPGNAQVVTDSGSHEEKRVKARHKDGT